MEFLYFKSDFRIFFDEGLQKHREQGWHYGGNNTEPEQSPYKSFLLIDNILNPITFVYDISGLLHNFPTGLG